MEMEETRRGKKRREHIRSGGEGSMGRGRIYQDNPRNPHIQRDGKRKEKLSPV